MVSIIAITQTLASRKDRFVAFALDQVMLAFLGLLMFMLFALPTERLLDDMVLHNEIVFGYFLLVSMYFLPCILAKHATPGMWLLGLAYVDHSGQHPRALQLLRQVYVRFVFFVLFPIVILIDCAMSFGMTQRQTLSNYLSGLKVVSVNGVPVD
jgi:uncharacterized RDD family membrane protein YckC